MKKIAKKWKTVKKMLKCSKNGGKIENRKHIKHGKNT